MRQIFFFSFLLLTIIVRMSTLSYLFSSHFHSKGKSQNKENPSILTTTCQLLFAVTLNNFHYFRIFDKLFSEISFFISHFTRKGWRPFNWWVFITHLFWKAVQLLKRWIVERCIFFFKKKKINHKLNFHFFFIQILNLLKIVVVIIISFRNLHPFKEN